MKLRFKFMMKLLIKILIYVAIALGVATIFVLCTCEVKAEMEYNEPVVVRSTCYIDKGYTASGAYTRHGIAAAKKEWIGCVAALYQVNEDGSIGEFIGYYEILDTGSASWLKDGTAIDVWCDGMDEVHEWQTNNGDYVYMQLIEGEG